MPNPEWELGFCLLFIRRIVGLRDFYYFKTNSLARTGHGEALGWKSDSRSRERVDCCGGTGRKKVSVRKSQNKMLGSGETYLI